jgi:hypothetical protein
MIFLKMQVFINFGADGENNVLKSKMDTFELTAQKIERVKLNESDFIPPADYSFANYKRPLSRDSVRIKEITLEDLKQEEDKKAPPPPPPPKTPKPVKTPPKKEKGTNPVKG